MSKLVLDPNLRTSGRPHVMAKLTNAGAYVAQWPLCSTAVHRAKVLQASGKPWVVEPIDPPSPANHAYCRACRRLLPGGEAVAK